MKNKNPLEEIRDAIFESQLLGIENEITQMGVSSELLKISDAFDKYYGIKRNPKPTNPSMSSYIIQESPILTKMRNEGPWASYYTKERFVGVNNLIDEVKEPLLTIKSKLTQDNAFYINLSSMIVAISVRFAVSAINSYEKPSYHDYARYYSYSDVDSVLITLVSEAFKVFDKLKDFDKSKECLDNYETNRKALLSIGKSISQTSRTTQTTSRNSSTGCMVLAIALSTSIMVCIGTVLLIII